ncbi:hypothetical protein L6R49_26965 [Myxococcota bacterium]|nr:hypothetical protein [Myxococcota bacterium]
MEEAAEAALRRRLDALAALGAEARALQLELVEAVAAATEAGAPAPKDEAPSLWARLFGAPPPPPTPAQSPRARLREAWAAVMTRLRRLSQHAELLEAELGLGADEDVAGLLTRALEDQAALQREARDTADRLASALRQRHDDDEGGALPAALLTQLSRVQGLNQAGLSHLDERLSPLERRVRQLDLDHARRREAMAEVEALDAKRR